MAIFIVVLAAITRQAVTYLLGDVVDIVLNQSIEKTLKLFIYLIVGVSALLVLVFFLFQMDMMIVWHSS